MAIAETVSFAELLARVRQGDERAAEELFRSYEAHIRRIVRVQLTDPAMRRQLDSVDICQSVMSDFFVRASLGQYELNSPRELAGLLATMARNRLLNHLGRQRAQRRDIRRLEPTAVDQLSVAATDPTPSRIISNRELLSLVRSRLSDEDRYLADRRAAGATWPDLARELGRSPDALRVRLSRSLDRVTSDLGLQELQR